ncbi:hypothetical protein [Deinococcus sp.]|uniref:hypothetical protein n=1 Tax=Deinococcus sp. TaxID=47478 RepID=UPI003CC65F3A
MIPTYLNTQLLQEHLEALRLEAAQARALPRAPSLLSRLRDWLRRPARPSGVQPT